MESPSKEKRSIEQAILTYLRDHHGVATLAAVRMEIANPSVPDVLKRLLQTSRVERLRRGVYRLPDADFGLYPEFVEAIAQAPHAAIGLASALSYHGLSTINPGRVYLIQPKTARVPKISSPMATVIKTTEACFTGITRVPVGEATVLMTDPAKTVVDCWKYRRIVGSEVAIEALRDYLRRRGASVQQLREYAKACRVLNLMTPYIESMLA